MRMDIVNPLILINGIILIVVAFLTSYSMVFETNIIPPIMMLIGFVSIILYHNKFAKGRENDSKN